MSDKIKTLSQAIRLGATFRPQCKWAFFHSGGSCALGAAAEAIGFTDAIDSNIASVLEERFPAAFRIDRHCCPVVNCNRFASNNAILAGHLNDDHGWTRERIADWLETQGK